MRGDVSCVQAVNDFSVVVVLFVFFCGVNDLPDVSSRGVDAGEGQAEREEKGVGVLFFTEPLRNVLRLVRRIERSQWGNGAPIQVIMSKPPLVVLLERCFGGGIVLSIAFFLPL